MTVGCGNKNTEDNNDQDVSIETDYGTLHFPKEWEDSFSYKIDESDVYTVKFIGKISEDTSAELFSVIFGEKGQLSVGKITGDNGCEVYVTPGTVKKEWSKDELTTFQAMQEEMNYTIEKLCRRELCCRIRYQR